MDLSNALDLSLDDIVKIKNIKKHTKHKFHGGGGGGPQNKYSRQNQHRQGGNGATNFRSRGGGHTPVPAAQGIESSKIIVSNLAYSVSSDDVQELFAEFGQLRRHALHFDQFGKSLGTAEVVFVYPKDATKAVKQYDGVPLDGRPMKIQFAVSDLPKHSSTLTARLGYHGGGRIQKRNPNPFKATLGRGMSDGGGPKKNHGGGGSGGSSFKKRSFEFGRENSPNLQDLDKEMDEYNRQKSEQMQIDWEPGPYVGSAITYEKASRQVRNYLNVSNQNPN